MIESVAYFEAYFHILNKLKMMDLWTEMSFMDKIDLIQKHDLNKPDYMKKA